MAMDRLQYLQQRERERTDAADHRGSFRKGISSGIDKTQGLVLGAGGALADAAGFDKAADVGLEGYQRNMEEAGESAGDVTQFSDVRSAGDFGSYLAFTLGDQLPTMLGFAATGGAGAVAGVAAKKAAKNVVERRVQREVAKLTSAGMGKDEALKAASKVVGDRIIKAGAKTGAITGAITAQTGGIYGDVFEETGEKRPGVALTFGALSGALEAAPFMQIISRTGGAAASQGLKQHLLSKIPGGIARYGAAESVTEGMQSAIELAAVDYVEDNLGGYELSDLKEIGNAMAAGFFVGGAMGIPATASESAKFGRAAQVTEQLTDITNKADNSDISNEAVFDKNLEQAEQIYATREAEIDAEALEQYDFTHNPDVLTAAVAEKSALREEVDQVKHSITSKKYEFAARKQEELKAKANESSKTTGADTAKTASRAPAKASEPEVAAVEKLQKLEILDGDVLTGMGSPFNKRKGAEHFRKRNIDKYENFEPVSITGGYVLREKANVEASQVSDEIQTPEGQSGDQREEGSGNGGLDQDGDKRDDSVRAGTQSVVVGADGGVEQGSVDASGSDDKAAAGRQADGDDSAGGGRQVSTTDTIGGYGVTDDNETDAQSDTGPTGEVQGSAGQAVETDTADDSSKAVGSSESDSQSATTASDLSDDKGSGSGSDTTTSTASTTDSTDEKVADAGAPKKVEPDGKTSTAAEIKSETAKVAKDPTDGQKEAGNYPKGHIKWMGFDVAIENPKGSKRSGKDANGNEWSNTMGAHYGDLKGTTGADGDPLDIFLGKDIGSKKIFIIDQVNPADGEFDEHKIMAGFTTMKAAREAYMSSYDGDWKGLGKISATSVTPFKAWVADGDLAKPFNLNITKKKPKFNATHELADGTKVVAHEDDDGVWVDSAGTEFIEDDVGKIKNAPGSNANLEPDSADPKAADPVGDGVVPDGRRAADSTSGEERAGDGGLRGVDTGGASVSTRDATAAGTPSDKSVRDANRTERSQISAALSDDSDGSSNPDAAGIQPDRKAAESAASNAAEFELELAAKAKAQKKAEQVKSIDVDLDNIRETLPYLLGPQQEDVHFVEQRLIGNGNAGALLTNGTGTGKTFSGLGVIKRFVRSGKGNVLVLVPSDKIAHDWKTSGKALGLDIESLADITDMGKGLNVTTYANFGQNANLVRREYDLVVADESHKLNQNQAGGSTLAQDQFRAITNHPDGAYHKARQFYRDQSDALDAKKDKHRLKLEKQDVPADEIAGQVDEHFSKQTEMLVRRIKTKQQQYEKLKPSKALFLSATPFAYVNSVDYAEGYLFDYPKQKPGENLPYNSGDGQQKFFQEHFGYRMRYNKLTKPEADVNQGLMQRQFNQFLKEQGSLRGRMLQVDADYSREFVSAKNAVGEQIDRGSEILRTSKGGANEFGIETAQYPTLQKHFQAKFTYLDKLKLLEAVKAEHAIERIKQHHKLGRKVVVFHSYNVGGAKHPFRFPGPASEVAQFKAEHRDLWDLDLSGLRSPINTLKDAFPDALFVNGTVPKKTRIENADKFNDDDGGHNLIVLQIDAGKEGISLHDTTGKYPRALINLGLPLKPTDSIQAEGRTYRTGQVSNAIFEYMNTGTSFERYAFASAIATRSSTAENLAMGHDARNLLETYVEAFETTNNNAPSENQGIGGQELDRNREEVTEFEKAKTYYFGRQKKTSRNKAAEGNDYFATPEPLGMKMVEWAGIRASEDVLEPSVGHGAIGRFFPKTAKSTFVEPSSELATQAMLHVDGEVLQQNFEDLHIVNKYDAIVMNPPFGSGGKTAVEHIAKATMHLRNGGRVVAIMPEGPAAEKKFNKWYESDAAKGIHLVANIGLTTKTFERAATSVKTRVVILDKATNDKDKVAIAQSRRDIEGDTVNDIFDSLEDRTAPDRVVVAPKETKGTSDVSFQAAAAAPSSGNYRQTANVARMAAEIKSKWKTDFDIKVLPNMAAAPGDIQKAAKQQGIDSFEAVYKDGQLYVVADAIRTQAQLEQALLHERQHALTREALGRGNVEAALLNLSKKVDAAGGIKKIADNNGIDMDVYIEGFQSLVDSGQWTPAMRDVKLMDELLAFKAGNAAGMGSIKRAFERVVQAIRKVLRQMGFINTAPKAQEQLMNILFYTQGYRRQPNEPQLSAGALFDAYQAESSDVAFSRFADQDGKLNPQPPRDPGTKPPKSTKSDDIVDIEDYLIPDGTRLERSKDGLVKVARMAGGAVKREALGLMTRRQLVMTGSELVPRMLKYLRVAEQMDADKHEWQGTAADVTEKWSKLPTEMAQRMAAVMHQSTVAGIDPSKTYTPLITKPEFQKLHKKITRELYVMQQGASKQGTGPVIARKEALEALWAQEQNREKNYPQLLKNYNTLSSEAKQSYNDARDHFNDLSAASMQALEQRIIVAVGTGKAKKDIWRKIRAEFESNRVTEPYFPLSRFGDHWVVSTKDKERSVDRFETLGEQKEFVKMMQADGYKTEFGKDVETLASIMQVPTEFLQSVDNLLDTGRSRDDDPATYQLRDQIYQLYLQTLPEMSARKNFIHRKNVKGFSKDALRAFAKSSFHMASMVARLKHGYEMEQHLVEMKADVEQASKPRISLDRKALLEDYRDNFIGKATIKQLQQLRFAKNLSRDERKRFADIMKLMETHETTDMVDREIAILNQRLDTAGKINQTAETRASAANYVSELNSSHQRQLNPNTSPAATALNSLGFGWFLGVTPAAAMINTTQVPMVTIPILGGKHGYGKATNTVGDIYKSFFAPTDAAGKKLGKSDRFSLKNKLVGEELDAFRELVRRGTLDLTQAHDLVGLAEEGQAYNHTSFMFKKVISFGFHHAERLNREITSMAAFRLAKESGMDFEQAVQEAVDITQHTQFDYAAANRARYFSGNWPRVFLQFKQYSAGITYLYLDTYRKAFKNADPDVRKEAKRSLAGLLGIQFAVTGALGMPVARLAGNVVETLVHAFDEEDDWDYEVALRQGLANLLGSNVGSTALTKGLFDSFIPIGLHGRLSLSELWIRQPDKELEGRDAHMHYLKQLAGPTLGGIFSETLFEGPSLMLDGEIHRGLEKMTPKFIRDQFKAARYMNDGVQTMRGNNLIDLSAPEIMLQSLGFSPARLSSRYEENNAKRNKQTQISTYRRKLMRNIIKAQDEGTRAEQRALDKELRRFNKEHDYYPILPKNLKQSRASKKRADSETVEGFRPNRRMRGVLADIDFAQ